jgi:C-terminal processing protease CtpA/Prc
LESFDSGVRLTTAKFYSPSGRPYSRIGVDPDVAVHQAARPVDGSVAAKDDTMLTAAVDAVRGLTRPR